MRWYDLFLKGSKPKVADPPIVVQTSDGSWRGEDRWPPRDSKATTSQLKPGSYNDNGMNNGTEQGYPETGDGVWTFSPPTGYDVHLAGIPSATLDVDPAPGANLVVDVYDVDLSDNATLISRNTMLLGDSGKVTLPLYGNDWIIRKHHRIGVLVTGSNAEWWMHQPTGQDVNVKSAQVALPFLTCRRGPGLEGDPSMKLESYLKNAPFQVDSATVKDRTEAGFALPPAQKGCSLKAGHKAKKKRGHKARKRGRRRH
jgi:hypothetical protein